MTEAFEPGLSSIAGWRRFYVDLPGTGGSPAGEPRSDAVLDELAATVTKCLDGDRFAVVGWSYGGYLAAGLVRRLPRPIRGMTMICSGFKIRPEQRNLSGVLQSIPEPGWLARVPVDLREYFSHAVGRQSADVAERVAAVLTCNAPTDESYLASLRAEGFALSDEDTPSPTDAPSCFLTGRRDRIAGYLDPIDALNRYPYADCVTIAEAGHYLPLEEPQLFASIMRAWLRRVESAWDSPPS
jgi:pimeloyl-ACP methyl ester carboxylesterase